MDFAVAFDFEFEVFRQRVDDRDAYPVQTARDFVRGAVEFAASVKFGQDDLSGGEPFSLHEVGGDATPVVGDRDAVVDMDGDVNVGAVAGERFIDGIIDDLENEVMKPSFGGVADVHSRSFADSFESLKHFDLTRSVVLFEHVSLNQR